MAEEKQEQRIVEVPVFLTRAEIDRMIYENNLMLKRLLTSLAEKK